MARKTTDQAYLTDKAQLIAKDAFSRSRDDPKGLSADEIIQRSEDQQQRVDELIAWIRKRTDSLSKREEFELCAQILFMEICENIDAETAAIIFHAVSRRKRSKMYSLAIERALCFHAKMTGSTYETAKFAHEEHQIGNSVVALQKHIQRLLAKSGDRKPRTKSRDK
jgi:hypothetical protein